MLLEVFQKGLHRFRRRSVQLAKNKCLKIVQFLRKPDLLTSPLSVCSQSDFIKALKFNLGSFSRMQNLCLFFNFGNRKLRAAATVIVGNF